MGTRWYDSDQFVSERKQKKFFRCLSGKKTICPNTFNFTEISFKTLIPGDGWQADEKKNLDDMADTVADVGPDHDLREALHGLLLNYLQ